MLSFTITDMSGRNLSGHTITAFWYARATPQAPYHRRQLRFRSGPAAARTLPNLQGIADALILAYPNAGLPNELGEYDELPDTTATLIREWCDESLVNVVGGCCGTTPEHIAAISKALDGLKPHTQPELETKTRLAGLEPFTMAA